MKPLDALTAIRGSIGVAALFAPRVVAWSLGVRGGPGEELRYVMRIWGARNVVFALATPRDPGSWLPGNVAIDLLDLASGVVYARRTRPGVRGVAVATVPPLVAAALGTAAARGPGAGASRIPGDEPT
ncbi:MAG TPA: hypothetical protein VF715_06035 [Thermoleophilaceae bacterium]